MNKRWFIAACTNWSFISSTLKAGRGLVSLWACIKAALWGCTGNAVLICIYLMAKLRPHSRWLVQVTHQSYFDPLSQQSPSMNKWQGVSGTTEQVDAEHYWLTRRLNRCLTSLYCIYDNWFKEETLNCEMGTLSAHSFWCHQQQTDKMFMSNAENVSSHNLLFPHIFSSLEKYRKIAFFKLTVDFFKILFSSTRWIESCCRTHWAPVHPCAGKQVLLYMTEKGRSHHLCCGVWAHLWQSKELLLCYDTSILKGADIVWIMKLSATSIVQFVGQNVWMLLFFSTHVWADQG